MAAAFVSVEQYSLTVDAAETIRCVLDSGDTVRGAALADALGVGVTGKAVFVVAPDAPVVHEDFCPGSPARDGQPEVAAATADEVLSRLQTAGVVSLHGLWREVSGEAYLSDGRTLTAVQVLRPFTLVSVVYTWSTERRMGCADQWRITNVSAVVPPGTYIVGCVGDYSTSFVGAAGAHTADLDVLTSWVVQVEGFGASRCEAQCAACGGRWVAESGSWHFRPVDGCAASGWEFDDAAGFDTNTIACPVCRTGRVGFLVL